MLIFTWLSRKQGNVVIYYPNRILRGMDPWDGGSATRNPFAWIREAMASSEQDVINASGVDTAVYFVFLTTVLAILSFSSLLLLPVLLPVAATAIQNKINHNDTANNGSVANLDKLSMAHVPEKSSRLWAFLFGVYWVSVVTYYLLWKAYHHVSTLRANALMAPDVRPEQFAVLVRDIPAAPEGQTRKEQVDIFFKDIYPETFYRSMIVTNNKQAEKIYQELEGYKKKLSHTEAVFDLSKTAGKPEGTRPTNRTGFLGLIGSKVDSIDYYNEKINETSLKLEAEQKVTLQEKQQAAAVVFFTNRVTAANASQSLHAQIVDHWTVMEAPEPRQLLWTNLNIKYFERQVRQYIIYAIVFLTVVFYMIPITFISAITTLDNLRKTLPFLKTIVDIAALKTVLQAYLPQLALIIFLALLPNLLLFLSKTEGIPSQSHAVRATSGKYFYFTVFNVFLGVTIGGSLFGSLKQIEDHPNSTVTLLATSLPGNASFFITFVALRFFVGYGLELSRLVPLIIYHLKRKYLCKTEAERKVAWYPGDLSYATRLPSDMLILIIVICYSIIAPIILLFGIIYFGLGWLILRNQALKVYVPTYESYGRMWPHMFKRIIASLLLFQVTMFGYFAIKKFIYVPIVIPPIVITLLFAYVCQKKFYRAFQYTSLENACRELKEVPNLELVYRAYLPPCLNSEKIDEEHFTDALSQA
ncbi:hypothetical protein ACFE04_012087 [Oxalis oulophora]